MLKLFIYICLQVLYFELLDTNTLLLGRNLPRISFWTTANMALYEGIDQKPDERNEYGALKAIFSLQPFINCILTFSGYSHFYSFLSCKQLKEIGRAHV